MLGLFGGELTNREQLEVFSKDKLIDMYIYQSERNQTFLKEILDMSIEEFTKFQENAKLMLQVIELTKKDFQKVGNNNND